MTINGKNIDPRGRTGGFIGYHAAVQGAARLEGDLHAAVADSELSKDILVITPEEMERYRHVSGTIVGPALETGLVMYQRAA